MISDVTVARIAADLYRSSGRKCPVPESFISGLSAHLGNPLARHCTKRLESYLARAAGAFIGNYRWRFEWYNGIEPVTNAC